MSKLLIVKILTCFTCNVVLLSLLFSLYREIQYKKEIIRTQNPIEVTVLEISRGRSRASCEVEYNDIIYKGISLPSSLKLGINKTDFYYDYNDNKIFSNNLGIHALQVGSVMFIISLYLWFVPKKYFKL